MGNAGYYVVLVNNGRRTAACFEDREEFESWYSQFRCVERVVARGVSPRKAVELADDIENNSRFARLIRGEFEN